MAAPRTTVPAKNQAAAGISRSAQAAARTTIASTMARSLPSRRPSAADAAASALKQRTGSVVRRPAAVRDKPRSVRMSGSSGDTAAMPARRLNATRTMARMTAVALVAVRPEAVDVCTGASERVLVDRALHGQPLRVGERLDVRGRTAEPGTGAGRAPAAERGDRLVVHSLI